MHYKQCAKCSGEMAIVWRLMGGPSIKPVSVDDEEKTAQVTLSSGTLSEDETLPFRDPDDRLLRLHKKPLAMLAEPWPAAVDAELAEYGHWKQRKEESEGIERDDGRIDPWLPASPKLRAANPIDAMALAAKSVSPEDVKTAKKMTEARYDKYQSGIGAKETLSTMVAFAVGAGTVVGVIYVRDEIMGSSSGGGSASGTVPLPPSMLDLTAAVGDLAVTLL
jgi:hypothetical protein